jgi:rhodanese-related sulfurtransferase
MAFIRYETLLKRHGIAVLLIAAGWAAAMAVAGRVYAGGFEETACYVFGGRKNCRTVKVFDAEECIIKVHPNPLPILEPEVAACLLDEVQTKMVFLRKIRPSNMAISNRITVKGTGVVEVLTRYDDNGAAVWESRNADTFEIKGSIARTRVAIEKFSSEFCTGQSRMVGGGTSGGIIKAEEAFKRASEGSIVLVDIRLPSEWQDTGIGVNAVAITMHQKFSSFVDELTKAAGTDKRPFALICAEGVRSMAMQEMLMQYGFQGVLDVHEGMTGGKSGPGWIKSGLPVIPFNQEQANIGQ